MECGSSARTPGLDKEGEWMEIRKWKDGKLKAESGSSARTSGLVNEGE